MPFRVIFCGTANFPIVHLWVDFDLSLRYLYLASDRSHCHMNIWVAGVGFTAMSPIIGGGFTIKSDATNSPPNNVINKRKCRCNVDLCPGLDLGPTHGTIFGNDRSVRPSIETSHTNGLRRS